MEALRNQERIPVSLDNFYAQTSKKIYKNTLTTLFNSFEKQSLKTKFYAKYNLEFLVQCYEHWETDSLRAAALISMRLALQNTKEIDVSEKDEYEGLFSSSYFHNFSDKLLVGFSTKILNSDLCYSTTPEDYLAVYSEVLPELFALPDIGRRILDCLEYSLYHPELVSFSAEQVFFSCMSCCLGDLSISTPTREVFTALKKRFKTIASSQKIINDIFYCEVSSDQTAESSSQM